MLTPLLFTILSGILFGWMTQDNTAPMVKITAPTQGSHYDWNTQVQYNISVSDKEDGESKYDEISPTEVFLEVKYVQDISTLPKDQKSLPDAVGITLMKQSNCFNCHALRSKLIAPSFQEILQRYPPTAVNMERLSKRIQEGSGGIWGAASMPSHPELTAQETSAMVLWIIQNANDPTIDYYTGVEGSFRLKLPVGHQQQSAIVITATYSDHGSKTFPKDRRTTKDVITIFGR